MVPVQPFAFLLLEDGTRDSILLCRREGKGPSRPTETSTEPCFSRPPCARAQASREQDLDHCKKTASAFGRETRKPRMTTLKAHGPAADTAAFLAGGPVTRFHDGSPETTSQQCPRQVGRQVAPRKFYLVFFLGVVAPPFLVDLLLLPVLATASSTPFKDNATPMRPMTTAINMTLLKLLTSISMPPAQGCGRTTHDHRKTRVNCPYALGCAYNIGAILLLYVRMGD